MGRWEDGLSMTWNTVLARKPNFVSNGNKNQPVTAFKVRCNQSPLNILYVPQILFVEVDLLLILGFGP